MKRERSRSRPPTAARSAWAAAAPLRALGSAPKGQRGWNQQLVEEALTDLSLSGPHLSARGDHLHYANPGAGLSLNLYVRKGTLLVQGVHCVSWDATLSDWKRNRSAAAPDAAPKAAARGGSR